MSPVEEQPRFGHVDGTCWPLPHGPSEYALRYGGEPHRMHTAAVLSAYAHLTDPSISQRAAIEALKLGRVAVATGAPRAEQEPEG